MMVSVRPMANCAEYSKISLVEHYTTVEILNRRMFRPKGLCQLLTSELALSIDQQLCIAQQMKICFQYISTQLCIEPLQHQIALQFPPNCGQSMQKPHGHMLCVLCIAFSSDMDMHVLLFLMDCGL